MQLLLVADPSALCYYLSEGDYLWDKKIIGKTSGSRVMFTSEEYRTKILLHKPHPRKELLEYQVKQLIEQLQQEDLI